MSFPEVGGVEVVIDLPAGEAAKLARQINEVLSRILDFQEKEKRTGTGRELRDVIIPVKRETLPLRWLMREIKVCRGVKIRLIPDMPSPKSSAFGYYSGPEEGQYLPDYSKQNPDPAEKE